MGNMEISYSLRISFIEDSLKDIVSDILGIKPNMEDVDWGLEKILLDESQPYFEYFLELLDGKFEKLESIGILRSDISIWVLYQYDHQCNMEFIPTTLKRLGENGIALCISCWSEN